MQFREDVTSEATEDLVSADGSLTARRRRSAMVCYGGVSGLLFVITLATILL